MIRLPLLLLVLTGTQPLASLASSQGAASNAAVQKDIEMLQDMLATAKKEKHEEEVKYADFETFCVQETADLKKEIAEAAEQIELLASEIQKLTADVAGLSKEITQLGSDV